MLFRFGAVHRVLGWILTAVGVAILGLASRGYLLGGQLRGEWVVAGLLAIVAGTSLVRWARRARPD
jgi:hypothetical protein